LLDIILGRLAPSGGFGSGLGKVTVFRAAASRSLAGAALLWEAPSSPHRDGLTGGDTSGGGTAA
jgi:hypothetical protein